MDMSSTVFITQAKAFTEYAYVSGKLRVNEYSNGANPMSLPENGMYRCRSSGDSVVKWTSNKREKRGTYAIEFSDEREI